MNVYNCIFDNFSSRLTYTVCLFVVQRFFVPSTYLPKHVDSSQQREKETEFQYFGRVCASVELEYNVKEHSALIQHSYLQQISCTQASARRFLDWHLFYCKHKVRSESLSRIAAKEKITSSFRIFFKNCCKRKRGLSVWGWPTGSEWSVCTHMPWCLTTCATTIKSS